METGTILTFSTAPAAASDGDLVMLQHCGPGDPRRGGEINRIGRVVGDHVVLAGQQKPVHLARTILLGVAVWERHRLLAA